MKLARRPGVFVVMSIRMEEWDRDSAAIRRFAKPERPQHRGLGDALRTIYGPADPCLPDDMRCLLEKLTRH